AFAVANVQLADHAASRMLHLLHIRIDNQHPRGYDCARQLSCRPPPTDARDQHDQGCGAAESVSPDRPMGGCSWSFHDDHPCASPTTLGICDTALGVCNTLRSTSSFGPNACDWPLAIASTRSTPARAAGR